MDIVASRICQVVLETFDQRDRITGWSDHTVPSIDEALKDIPVDAEQRALNCELANALYPNDGSLSRDEGLAVYLYTAQWNPPEKSLYTLLNNALRNKDRSRLQPFRQIVKLLNSAIVKAIISEQTLWRGADEDLFDYYHQSLGETIVFWGYTSVTTDIASLNQYLDDEAPKKTYFSIRTRSAADLHKYSAVYTEAELLIAAGTEFKVMNVCRLSEALTVIVLVEERNMFGVNPRPAIDQPVNSIAITSSAKKLMDTEAFYEEGLKYEHGTGVEKDEVKAKEYYELAADNRHAAAEAQLGFFYDYGKGNLNANTEEAIRYYVLSAEKGDASGQFYLGTVYHWGRLGIPKNEGEALRLYSLSADQGHAYAQFCLGLFYEKGLGGLVRDEDEARRLYTLAAQQGHELASRWLSEA